MREESSRVSVPPPERAIYRAPERDGGSPVTTGEGVLSQVSVTRARGCRLSPFILALCVMIVSSGALALAGFWLSQAAVPRSNVLVLGLDRRPEQGYLVRSDVVMLVTARSREPRLTLLSIPRDLYVDIPGYGQNRINTAHFWGEQEGAGKGPLLAVSTVSEAFGVPVRHYVRVDFQGFRAVVDAAGGIDIEVRDPIVDHAYPTEDYGTTRIEIPAGHQHMDGERALQYVRSRHGSSDFERAERQQQVMTAVVEKLVAPANWSRIPAVLAALVENVDSNLGPIEASQIAATVLRVGPEGMERYVIDRDMTRPWTTPTGGAVLLPRWEVIGPLADELGGP